MPRRRAVLVVILLLDLLALLILTHWVMSPSSASGATLLPEAAGKPTTAKPAARPAPARVSNGNDQAISGGPRFVTCGAADADGAVWLGSEDQGLYRFFHGIWTHFGAGDGVADDNISSLACDQHGHIWAGTVSHGVSIYNGNAWHNIDVFHGPIGSRIFAVASSPIDGSMWLATSAGLCRYALTTDTWSYFDRSTGMPDDLVSCLAFDRDGTLYAGLQADGMAIASAADNYTTWKHVTGPDEMPIVGAGQGLPGPLVNAICVDARGVIYAGTTRGLARSYDHGATWNYLRGGNWPDLAQGRYEGVPADFKPDTTATPLLADWITSLALDNSGTLWIGYREAGFQSLFPSTDVVDYTGKGKVTCIVAPPDAACLVGTYGQGVTQAGVRYASDKEDTAPAIKVDAKQATFPLDDPPLTAEKLDALRKTIATWPLAAKTISTLPDDWQTKGNWIGRYGKQYAVLCGYAAMNGSRNGDAEAYNVGVCPGPYRPDAAVNSYENLAAIKALKSPENAIFNPWEGHRVTGEYNDGGYDLKAYPRTQEGPDLYVQVHVPDGVHQLSIYFHNFDGHASNNIYRDYLLLAKSSPASGLAADNTSGKAQFISGDLAVDAELAPTLARSRVPGFWNGVYKRFVIHGAGVYWIKISRNHSMAAKMQAVFIDRLDQPEANSLKLPEGMELDPLPPDPVGNQPVPVALGSAYGVWDALDKALDKDADGAQALRYRMLAYRVANTSGAPASLLTRWRRQIAVWNDGDRVAFDTYVKAHTR